jgi:ABC-type Fe3+ transport system permease subunit
MGFLVAAICVALLFALIVGTAYWDARRSPNRNGVTASARGSRPQHSGATRPLFWIILLACLATFVAVPVVIFMYPLPDVPGGWCQSGGRPGHYQVESVAKGLLVLDGVAAAALVAAVAMFTRTIPWILAALALGLGAVYFGYLIYGGEIECAFW